MTPLHFIPALVEVYERAWSIIDAPTLADEFKDGLAEIGIHAANQIAANNWAGEAARAGQIGAALLRRRFGAEAAEKALELSPWLQMAIANSEDPPRRAEATVPPLGVGS